jgi:UDP-arabinose 4-epimerase
LLDGGEPRAFNLGTTRGVSVRELINVVEREVGSVPLIVSERSAGDAPILVADGSLSAQALSWSAHRSDIQLIVRTAAQWHATRRSRSAGTRA